MKNIITFVLILLTYVNVYSQTPFEGEIDFTTFANYCDYINNNGLMAGGNGIHRQTLTVKGDKGKLVNHTTGSVTVWDISTNQYVTYHPEIKRGVDYTNNLEAVLVLVPRDTKLYGKFPQPITSNTIAVTNASEVIKDRQCSEMKGTLVREQGGRDSKYGIKAYFDPSVSVTPGLTTVLYGLEIPGLPLKWTYSYDGGHVPMVGELSLYLENTVTDIRPGEVDDSIFVFPVSKRQKKGDTIPESMTGYKLASPSNAFSLMGYFKEANKVAKAHIEEEKKSGKQDGYDSFQTSVEWDF